MNSKKLFWKDFIVGETKEIGTKFFKKEEIIKGMFHLSSKKFTSEFFTERIAKRKNIDDKKGAEARVTIPILNKFSALIKSENLSVLSIVI